MNVQLNAIGFQDRNCTFASSCAAVSKFTPSVEISRENRIELVVGSLLTNTSLVKVASTLINNEGLGYALLVVCKYTWVDCKRSK